MLTIEQRDIAPELTQARLDTYRLVRNRAIELQATEPLKRVERESSHPRTQIDIYPNRKMPLPLFIDLSKLRLYPHDLAYPIVLDEISITVKGLKGGDIKGVLQAKTGNNPQEFPPYVYPVRKPVYLLDSDSKTGLLIPRRVPVSVSITLEDISGKAIFGRDMSTGIVREEGEINPGMSFTLEYDNRTYIGASTFTPQSGKDGDDMRGRLELHRWFFDPFSETTAAMQIPSELAKKFFKRTLFTVAVDDYLLAK